jgi:hypothetical protein
MSGLGGGRLGPRGGFALCVPSFFLFFSLFLEFSFFGMKLGFYPKSKRFPEI